jgi:hypothetical protein
MRKYTLLVSIVVHATVVCAALILPIMATQAAPRPLERIRVVLAEPALPDLPRVRSLRPTPTVNPDAAPVDEPAGIAPEVPEIPAGPPGIDEHADLVHGGPGMVVAPFSLTRDEPPPPPPVPKPVPLRVGGVVRPPEKVHHLTAVVVSFLRTQTIHLVEMPSNATCRATFLGAIPVLYQRRSGFR